MYIYIHSNNHIAGDWGPHFFFAPMHRYTARFSNPCATAVLKKTRTLQLKDGVPMP